MGRCLEPAESGHRPLTVWSYGEPQPPGSPLAGHWRWCLEAYAAGCDGIAPWQSLGRQESWDRHQGTSLVYPSRPWMPKKPMPSLRLKALRDAQQDIEVLCLLTGETAADGAEPQANWGPDRARLIIALTGCPPYTRRGVAGAPLVTAELADLEAGEILELRQRLLKALD